MIKDFDLTGWVCFSDRRNSKSYYSADKKWMVKFDTEVTKRDEAGLEKERDISLKALEIGIKTPKVQDVVELPDGTLGLIYEYIEGKKSIARACGEDTDNIDAYMMRFARSAKDLHSKVCDPNKIDSFEDRIRRMLVELKFLNNDQMKKAINLLDNTEKKNTCLHGDFHTGNFIITKDEEFAIDLGSISYGNEIYDIACFYYFLYFMPSFVFEKLFHCEKKYGEVMWNSFVKYYYNMHDENEIAELNKKMRKYALVSFFGMAVMCKQGPEIKECIDENFDKVFAE